MQPTTPPVLLVHGIDADGAAFGRMAQTLRDAGRDVHVVEYRPSNGAVGLDRLAEQIGEYVDQRLPGGGRCDVVAFSMGGLVCRYYVQRLGGAARVRRLVTLSAPHNGTWTAYLRWNAAGRQMRPGSDFLTALNSDTEWLKKVEWTSIYTPLDLMIVPARSSVVAHAANQTVRVWLHRWMLTDTRVAQLIREVLEKPDRPGV